MRDGIPDGRREDPYFVVERQAFTARFLLGHDHPDSVEFADVHVHLGDGTRRYVTFMTLAAIELVMQRHRTSGEAAGGAYFWTTDLVVVPAPGVPGMTRALQELVRSGEIETAGQLLPDPLDDDG